LALEVDTHLYLMLIFVYMEHVQGPIWYFQVVCVEMNLALIRRGVYEWCRAISPGSKLNKQS
jgi:hypothetical protein